jgi:hypothetical protein
MITAATPLIRRILLAVDACDAPMAELESVVRLAQALDAELQALFVEDADLLRLAALPFAREVGLASAARRRLQGPDLEHALHTQARRAQTALAMLAAQSGMRWSFRVARGQLHAQLTQAMLGTDMITVTLGGEPVQLLRRRAVVRSLMATTSQPMLVLPAGSRLQPPYLVVFDGSPAAEHALRLARQLAGEQGVDIRILFVTARLAVEALRHTAEAVLGAADSSVHYRVAPDCTPETLIRAIRIDAAGGLLLPLHDSMLPADGVAELLARIRCPVLLVP